MIFEDQEFSLIKVFTIVGVIVFVSSLIYISILTAKLIAEGKITLNNNAKEHIQRIPLTPTPVL